MLWAIRYTAEAQPLAWKELTTQMRDYSGGKRHANALLSITSDVSGEIGEVRMRRRCWFASS